MPEIELDYSHDEEAASGDEGSPRRPAAESPRERERGRSRDERRRGEDSRGRSPDRRRSGSPERRDSARGRAEDRSDDRKKEDVVIPEK